MKTIGIIGGLGPEATADYYKEIIKRYDELFPAANLNYPEMIIYSVSLRRLLGWMETKEYSKAAEYISSAINKLKKAGADFAAISANTPHLLFNEISQLSELPLISIVNATREEAQKRGLRKPGLIGTKFTMQADFYSQAFREAGMEVVIPNAQQIERINYTLFTELEVGIFKKETENEYLGIIQEMIDAHKIDSLILGCTEFPIMFTRNEYLGIPFLNTTRIHVHKIVDTCIK